MRDDEPIPAFPASAGVLRSARRLLRRKDRQIAGQFLAEGRPAVSEALASGGIVRRVLVEESLVNLHRDLLTQAATTGISVHTVDARSLGELTDTVTPQGILAVCRTVHVALDDAVRSDARLVVLCDRVRDPGNLGTVVRCADAFGADAVLVTADSVDLYNPKTVRASTGSLFHLPISVAVDLAEAVTAARAAGLRVLGADAAASCSVTDLAAGGELAEPTLWVLGNEAWGLAADRAALLDRLVALPIYGRAESLNLSTAAAVLLYASATAQRAGQP
ncbi:MAG: RNA methyltransferase [Microlunatus sp.]|nr:RNA methyltransferase [Microlunatus sp.]